MLATFQNVGNFPRILISPISEIFQVKYVAKSIPKTHQTHIFANLMKFTNVSSTSEISGVRVFFFANTGMDPMGCHRAAKSLKILAPATRVELAKLVSRRRNAGWELQPSEESPAEIGTTERGDFRGEVCGKLPKHEHVKFLFFFKSMGRIWDFWPPKKPLSQSPVSAMLRRGGAELLT